MISAAPQKQRCLASLCTMNGQSIPCDRWPVTNLPTRQRTLYEKVKKPYRQISSKYARHAKYCIRNEPVNSQNSHFGVHSRELAKIEFLPTYLVSAGEPSPVMVSALSA